MAKTTTTTQTQKRNPEIVNAVQHFEIVSSEPVKLKKFLEKQFGWNFTSQKMPGMTGEYHSFRTPDGNGGGVLAPQMPDQPIAVTPYINVTDCNASQKSYEKNGATILMPTTDIPGVGKFFVFSYTGSPPLACFQSTGNNQ
jgi:predicted enzyme related to lactoylglutathione lyase